MGHLRKSLIFSALRYLEYGIIALSYIIIAKKVGPAEYSKTIPGFIFITYSQYLMMGLNQALMKAYVVESELEIKQTYVKNTLYYICFISLVAFLTGIMILPKQLFIVSLISSMIYFQSIFQTLLRLENKILGINISNLVFSIIYFVLVFFYAYDIKHFFLYWLLSLTISNVINGIQAYPILQKLQLRFYKKDILNIVNTIKPQIKLGIKMTLIGLISTYFLTYDRFLLNFFSDNKSLKGNYQLADNIASTIYLFFVTVVFYYFPILLKRASLNSVYRFQILKYGAIFISIISALIIIIGPFSNVIILKYFPAYRVLAHYLIYQSVLKINILGIGVASTISIALNFELKFLKWWFMAISLNGLLLFILYKFSNKSIDEIVVITLVFQVFTILITNGLYLFINRKSFFVTKAEAV
ncbi:hypothetical protein [Mucilaginibacter sp. OK098]|uniref:hypothetical protein n=1 Tax=Mucilaginibacter sp. OK098 TaxID=1855297 RepID=UPI00091E7430|nr:hypothetical protein [Mucilaginibacter sp. OK098]SHL93219.1 hypothetical protein SAMN05216524_101222 [Mucilaginibacter sp. OK098]